MVTLLSRTLISEWYMARLSVKNGNRKAIMSYDEIILYLDTILGSFR